MILELVHCGLSDAAMFTPDGKVVQPAEAFYKRPVLVLRGRFRPVTNVVVDMLHCALAQFLQEPANQGEDVLVVTEMTLRHLQEGEAIDDRDFLDRVDLLRTLGRPVLISNFGEYYRLANYLHRHTTKLIGLVMGVPTLREIFEEKYYTHLAGGILESFGRMFKNDLKLYVYPLLDSADRDHRDRRRPPRRAQASAPLQLLDRKPAHPADPRLQAGIPEHVQSLARCLPPAARG